jgi:hypothetical protein
MSLKRSIFFKWAAAGAVAASALFTAASANADVSWSVGVSAPGVAVGVVNPPVYYPPAPVYTAPPPVYYQPVPRVYYRPPPPVYYRPAPVYYGPPAPVYYGPGYSYGYRRHYRRDWDDQGD